jgi:hypothetical protein
MISGKPVKSVIERTSMPAASQLLRGAAGGDDLDAELAEPAANSTIPVLSDTDSSARATCTSPGWAKWRLATASSRSDYRASTTRSRVAAVDTCTAPRAISRIASVSSSCSMGRRRSWTSSASVRVRQLDRGAGG